jgi:hypothetical protein
MADGQRRPPRGRPLVAMTAVLTTILLLAPQPARGEPLPLPIVSALPLPSILPSPLESTLTELVSPVASLIAPVQSILPTATLPPILPTATLPPILPSATLPPVLPTATPPLPLPTASPVPSATATATPSTSPGLVAPGASPLVAGPVVAPGTPPSFPGIGGPLGDLLRLLGEISIPALAAGIPTLLVIAFIAAQVLGGAAWTTLVRRGLGSWGLRVLRPAGSPEDLAGTPPEH